MPIPDVGVVQVGVVGVGVDGAVAIAEAMTDVAAAVGVVGGTTTLVCWLLVECSLLGR